MECNHKKDSEPSRLVTQDVELTEEVDDVPPPLPGQTSNYKNVQEWLFKICDKEKPAKSITTYNFGLFESPGNYTIFLVGLNKYGTAQHSVTRIEFEPTRMYFQLPKSEYENLNREHLLTKLTSQLKDFTKTEKFKTSFFAKAKTITTDFNGKIWSN